MATQDQIEANRRNAAHSTGPRTPEGKAASSMNALQSGIHAESSVIPGEDATDLAALTERLYQGCRPQTEIESLVVDNIIRHAWRLRRFDRIDAELLIHTIEDTNYPSRLQREAIMDLKRLQAERPQPQPPAPQPVETESQEPPIGFVSQTHIPEPALDPPALSLSPQNAVSGIPSGTNGSAPIGSTCYNFGIARRGRRPWHLLPLSSF